MQKNQAVGIVIAVVAVLSAVAGAYWLGANAADKESGYATQSTGHANTDVTTEEIREMLPDVNKSEISKDNMMKENLQYLIEEEKLAHDVYQTLYDQWGNRAFGNIKQSELSHQTKVLAVMEIRDIDDPRSDELGVFSNAELQTLYDDLIARGAKSATEALKVGVAIEEMDINDLKEMIAEVPDADADVAEMMQVLLEGSERHLAAFNRQLSR